MTIRELDLDIQHRSGKSNRVADALSRNPVEVAQVLQFQSVEYPNSHVLHAASTSVAAEGASCPSQSGGKQPSSQPEDSHTVASPPGVLAPLTLESDIKELQHQDSQLAPILQYHEQGVLPEDDGFARRLVLEAEMYEVVDGVLFFVSPTAPTLMRLAVPSCLKQTLMKEHHNGRFAGHFAERKVYSTMSKRYWWKGMRSDVSKFCRSCLVCASREALVARSAHHYSPLLWEDPLRW